MSNWEKAYLDEINWYIETFLEDEFEDDDDKEVLKEIDEKRKLEVVNNLLNDSGINEKINEAIRWYLFHY